MSKAKCKNCLQELESTSAEKTTCSCANQTFIIGSPYTQVGGEDLRKVQVWRSSLEKFSDINLN